MYKVNIYECSHSSLQRPLQILGEKLKEFILVFGEKELGSTQLTKPRRKNKGQGSVTHQF
jgi:hypothetical protein